MIEKAILSTAECSDLCGKSIIFEELVALYGGSILKPLRTLPNGSQNWAKHVVLATIAKAQAEGTLHDRPKVDAALTRLRASKAARSPAASS